MKNVKLGRLVFLFTSTFSVTFVSASAFAGGSVLCSTRGCLVTTCNDKNVCVTNWCDNSGCTKVGSTSSK